MRPEERRREPSEIEGDCACEPRDVEIAFAQGGTIYCGHCGCWLSLEAFGRAEDAKAERRRTDA